MHDYLAVYSYIVQRTFLNLKYIESSVLGRFQLYDISTCAAYIGIGGIKIEDEPRH